MLLKDLKLEEINSTIEDLTRVYDGLNVISARELTSESMQLALKHDVSIYDALYIAAAEKINGTLYTADQKLCNSAKEVASTIILKPTPA
jgi:predicted nucleic acid-binding protein